MNLSDSDKNTLKPSKCNKVCSFFGAIYLN
jgi:hypothetical protein